jgi:hypothetical protein
VTLENLVDRWDGYIDLVVALQEEADADGPVLSLMADLEDAGHHVRRRLEGVVARPTLLGPEAEKADLPVPPQPEVELATGDPEKAARLTDVPRDLFVVVNPAQPDLRPLELLLFPLAFSHVGPPRARD